VPSIALASPFFQRFDLKARGVRFARPPVEFVHPLDGGRAAIVSASVAETAARLGADGRSYRRLIGPLASHLDELCQVLLAPLRRPPAHPVTFARYALPGIWPASVLARLWHTPEARALLAGTAAHPKMPLTAAPTGGIALMLIALAHAVGYPVVVGGSARITDVMADAVIAAGGSIETGRWVTSLSELPPAAAVLLDTSTRTLSERVWFRVGTLPARRSRVNQRAVLVSRAGPAARPYGLRARVSSYGQKADLGRRVARLAWWAPGDAGRGLGRVWCRGPLPASGECLLGTSGPDRLIELFLTRGTYLAEFACRSGKMQ
jgi:phytoene dehydrogenase-like protein